MKGTAVPVGVKQECCTVSCFLSVEKSVAMLGVESMAASQLGLCGLSRSVSAVLDLRSQASGAGREWKAVDVKYCSDDQNHNHLHFPLDAVTILSPGDGRNAQE